MPSLPEVSLRGLIVVHGEVPNNSSIIELAQVAASEGKNIIVTDASAEPSAVSEGLPTRFLVSDSVVWSMN